MVQRHAILHFCMCTVMHCFPSGSASHAAATDIAGTTVAGRGGRTIDMRLAMQPMQMRTRPRAMHLSAAVVSFGLETPQICICHGQTVVSLLDCARPYSSVKRRRSRVLPFSWRAAKASLLVAFARRQRSMGASRDIALMQGTDFQSQLGALLSCFWRRPA